jgi:preprotein translocase subunit SecG
LLFIVLKTLFVIVCLFLILVILLQSGKGGDVAAAFGGSGSQTAFGPRGAQKPLEKATVVAAMIFMLLALIFSLPGIGTQSVVDESAAPTPTPITAPAAAPAASPESGASPEASPAKQ